MINGRLIGALVAVLLRAPVSMLLFLLAPEDPTGWAISIAGLTVTPFAGAILGPEAVAASRGCVRAPTQVTHYPCAPVWRSTSDEPTRVCGRSTAGLGWWRDREHHNRGEEDADDDYDGERPHETWLRSLIGGPRYRSPQGSSRHCSHVGHNWAS